MFTSKIVCPLLAAVIVSLPASANQFAKNAKVVELRYVSARDAYIVEVDTEFDSVCGAGNLAILATDLEVPTNPVNIDDFVRMKELLLIAFSVGTNISLIADGCTDGPGSVQYDRIVRATVSK